MLVYVRLVLGDALMNLIGLNTAASDDGKEGLIPLAALYYSAHSCPLPHFFGR